MQNYSPQGIWSRKWTFCSVLALLMLGMQSIWTLPALLHRYEAFSLLLTYALALVFLASPILAAEIWLGRQSRCNPLRAVQLLQAQSGLSKFWRVLGALFILVCFLILAYVVVLGGVLLGFTAGVVFDANVFIQASASDVVDNIEGLLLEPGWVIRWQTIFLCFVVLVSTFNINYGLGFIGRLFVPLIFLLLAVLLANNLSIGALSIEWSSISDWHYQLPETDILLSIIALAFFTLSLGMGAVTACSAYMPLGMRLTSTMWRVLMLTLVFTLLASALVYSLLMHTNVEIAEGPALLFMSIPLGFAQTVEGGYFSALFFLMVLLILWGSATVLLEPIVAWINESLVLPRAMAASLAGLCLWLGSIVVSLSYNQWQDVRLFGYFTPFHLIETLSANVLVPLVIVLNALFISFLLRTPRFDNAPAALFGIGSIAWIGHLRYIAPLVVAALAWHALRSTVWF